jgi:hypothetical protein
MFEQELLVPALHLRSEVHLRRQLRLQRAVAPLKSTQQSSVRSLSLCSGRTA